MKRSVYLLIYTLNATFAFATEDINRLRHELSETAPDTLRVWQFRDLAYYYQSVNPDSAIYFAQRGAELAQQIEFKDGEIWCLYQKALALESKHHLDSAFFTYQIALQMAEDSGETLSQAKLLNAIGVFHYFSGDFYDAVHFYHKGYDLADSLGYLEGKSYALNNLAIIYRQQRRYKEALELYDKSILIKEIEGDTAGIITGLYNKGLAYSFLSRYPESMESFLQAESLAEDYSGELKQLPNLAIGLGVAHYHLGDLAESRPYLEAGIQLAEPSTPEWIAASAYLGSIEAFHGKISQGLHRIEAAYDQVLLSGRKELLKSILKLRAITAEHAGDLALSTESWKAHQLLTDSLHHESSQWAMEDMQARFDLIEKENLIDLQRLELEKKATQRIWYLSLGFLLVLGLVTSVLFLRKIWKQKKQLSLEIKEREAALAENDLLLAEMHHRTKNNLQLLNSILSLHSRNTRDQKARKALQSSRDSVGAISLLHQQLYQCKDLRNISFESYIERLCAYFKEAFLLVDREIELNYHCDAFSLDIDQAIPIGLVINEMITNAIKHAFPNRAGRIDLLVTQEASHITIAVRDNGQGQIQQEVEEMGTGKELIQIFSQRFNAKFNYIDQPSGTHAEFSIPIIIKNDEGAQSKAYSRGRR